MPSFPVVSPLTVQEASPTEFFPPQRLLASNQSDFFFPSGRWHRIDRVFSFPAVAGIESTEFFPPQRSPTSNRQDFFLLSVCWHRIDRPDRHPDSCKSSENTPNRQAFCRKSHESQAKQPTLRQKSQERRLFYNKNTYPCIRQTLNHIANVTQTDKGH